VANREELFWWCAPGGDAAKGHLMTSLNTVQYGIASFTPNQVLRDVHQVCWDQNLTDLGGGKWTNMIVVPEAIYEANAPRLDYTTPGFNVDNAPGDFNLQRFDIWGLKVFRGTIGLFRGDDFLWQSQDVWTSGQDKATRFQHCVTENTNGTVTITQQRTTGLKTWTVQGQIPDGPVHVIFQDDNYDPPKRDGYNPNNNTWHWDNILIS
jgi:hypothetical protein